MTTKRFRVNDLVKYNYSEIGEYIDENHTDRPLRNDELVELLNELHEENQLLYKIEDFQELLAKNDSICHKRVIDLIDDRISNFSNVRAELLLHSDDDYRLEKLSFAIQNLRELKKEL